MFLNDKIHTAHKSSLNFICNSLLGLFDAVAKGLLNDEFISGARVLLVNVSNGALISSVWWNKNVGGLSEPSRIEEEGIQIGFEPSKEYPWYEFYYFKVS